MTFWGLLVVGLPGELTAAPRTGPHRRGTGSWHDVAPAPSSLAGKPGDDV